MAIRCKECGLRYRDVETKEQLTDEKVERHEKGHHHINMVARINAEAKKGR